MPWLKVSDASATHPIALAAMEADDADDRLVNELFGFMARCAVMSAQHEQDYVITLGTARVTAGSHERFTALAAAAERAGYWTRTTVPDAQGVDRPAFRLVEEKDLFHMILKAERAWETQRRADVANDELTVPVRLRDGDGCRWCGKTVAWRDRKSGRGATYDHIRPGKGAATPEDLVVACRACNGARKDEENTSFDRALMPPPAHPHYGVDTLAFLAEHDVRPTTEDRPAPAASGSTSPAAEQASQRDTAPAPASTAPTAHAAGSTAPATAAAHTAQRDTATGQERQREAVARDAGRPGATAAAGPAQRDEERRRPEDREQRIDEWLAARGPERASEPIAPHDLEEIEWAPEPPAEDAPEPDLQIPADRQAEGSGFPGSGRDGSGQVGTGAGWDVSGQDGSRGGSGGSGRRKRRRGRRSGRGRGGEAREG